MKTAKPVMLLDGSQEMWDSVPEHLQAGLARYLDEGLVPGSFLAACLRNDLLEAVCRAAPGLTIEDLRNLMQVLHTGAPGESWGSREKVDGWAKHPTRIELVERPKEMEARR